MMERILKNTDITNSENGVRNEIQRNHGLRKRFDTIMKNTDSMKLIHAEKMFGHSTPSIPLDETYADFSIESLFNEYKKAIPKLTIDDSERDKIKIENQNRKISELETTKQELNEIKQNAKLKDMEFEKRIRMLEKTREEI